MRAFILLGLFCACSTTAQPSSFDPEASPGLETQLASGKADGAFGSREISIGDTVTSETAGDGLVLFSLAAGAGDQLSVQVMRTSGDLVPGAYLYQGVSTFVRPDDYTVSAGSVVLSFTIAASGEHFVVVRAHRGEGSGAFALSIECTGGPCAGGSTLDGIARADQCLTRAADCAITELPRYNGAVGPARAQTLLDECLAAEGSDCINACDAAPELGHVCEVITSALPTLADTNRSCLVELAYCLDECGGMNPYGYDGDREYLETPTCWDGHQGSSSSATGHCMDYVNGIDVCGGSSYEAETLQACYALCEATEGAWYEGPFDGCMDACDNH